MTIQNLLEKLENGEKVVISTNVTLLIKIQDTIKIVYSKFTIDVTINGKIMTLYRVGDYQYKQIGSNDFSNNSYTQKD